MTSPSCLSLSFTSSSSCPLQLQRQLVKENHKRTKLCCKTTKTVISCASADSGSSLESTKLVTFLGKGGSGKTTSSVFAAQHFAMAGYRTCLVIQTQDTSAGYLLNCKIGPTPVVCGDNLSAVRLETTKMLLEPLDRLKRADSRLKITQGVLEGVVGEELSVLPAMDSIFTALGIEQLTHVFTNSKKTNNKGDKYDIVIYDGVSTDETLRMIGAASKARLYLKYIRNLAEKTDIGRLVGPSLLRLGIESLNLGASNSHLSGKTSSEIWDILDKMLEQGAAAVSDPSRCCCFLVMDPSNQASVDTALRYWGCTIQAGAHVAGAIAVSSQRTNKNSLEEVEKRFSPLSFACMPWPSMSQPIDWNLVLQSNESQRARGLFSSCSQCNSSMAPVTFDAAKKSIMLFMPGFEKSEIKLYQYRGGSELLVEAGDQRRVIYLPPKIQGKVSGAKFMEHKLVITMQ